MTDFVGNSAEAEAATALNCSVTPLSAAYGDAFPSVSISGTEMNDSVTYTLDGSQMMVLPDFCTLNVGTYTLFVTVVRNGFPEWNGSTQLTVSPAVRSIPTGLTASNPTISSIDLQWDSVGTSYMIEYSTDSTFNTSATINRSENAATVSNLTPGTTYFVRVRTLADDANYVDSAYSETISVTTAEETQKIATVLKTGNISEVDSAAVIPTSEAQTSSWNSVVLEFWTDAVETLHAGKIFSYNILFNSNDYTVNADSQTVIGGIVLQMEQTADAANDGTALLTLTFTVSEDFTAPDSAALRLAAVALLPNTAVFAENPVSKPQFTMENETQTLSVLNVCYDFDQSSKVDVQDLITFAKLYNKSVAEFPNASSADFNSDGRVSIADLILFAKNYGKEFKDGTTKIIFDPSYIAQYVTEPLVSASIAERASAPTVELAVQPAAASVAEIGTGIGTETKSGLESSIFTENSNKKQCENQTIDRTKIEDVFSARTTNFTVSEISSIPAEVSVGGPTHFVDLRFLSRDFRPQLTQKSIEMLKWEI